jgi:acid phosphatase
MCTLNSLTIPSDDFYAYEPEPSRLYRKAYMPNRETLPGNCALGQLTEIGSQQHVQLGNNERTLYVDTYGLLPPTLNASMIWLRSTDVYRTLTSAQSHLYGLYPPGTAGEDVGVLQINTIDQNTDDLVGNTVTCPYLNTMLAEIMNSSAWQANLQANAQLINQLTKAFNTTPPGFQELMDSLYARYCHNLSMPVGVTLDMFEQIVAAANWETNYILTYPLYSNLSLGSFALEVLNNIQNAVNNPDQAVKYFLFSAHDSTVGPLMALLGGFDHVWPPYASHIEFELWQSNSQPSQFFVQVKYNGEIPVLPGCGAQMCPVQLFSKVVLNNVPANMHELCTQGANTADTGLHHHRPSPFYWLRPH